MKSLNEISILKQSNTSRLTTFLRAQGFACDDNNNNKMRQTLKYKKNTFGVQDTKQILLPNHNLVIYVGTYQMVT